MTTTKEAAATAQLFQLLEARYALRVLWALKDGNAQTFRTLQESVGGITPNTLNIRLKELREATLVTHDRPGYSLTPVGTELLKRLSEMQGFATKWAASYAKKSKPPSAAA